MKFIGQYIQQFIARFRNDVYLEDISTGTIASGGNLGLDSNNKIVKATVSGGGGVTVSDSNTDDNFPVDEIVNSGYTVIFYGQKTYNGVAIISKKKPSSVEYNPVKTSANEARSLTAVIDGITIVNLYVVNGKDVGTDKYAYKLEWLKKLQSYTKSILSKTDQLVMLGDFNIAPTDDDVYDIDKTKDQIL